MRLVWVILSVAMLLGGFGCVRDNAISEMLFSPSQDKIAQAPVATVEDFVKSYRENSVKADNDYNGRWVKVRGRVAGIERLKWYDGRTYYQVALADDTGKETKTLSCRFNFNRESDIVTLKKDTVITLYGRIDKVIEFGEMPTVSDCKLVK